MNIQPEWKFINPVKIVFGVGCIKKLPLYVTWDSALLVTTKGATQRGFVREIINALPNTRVTIYDNVRPEPQLIDLEKATESLGKDRYDGILAFGGGSSIDTAKVLSYNLSANDRSLRDHFEHGDPLSSSGLLPVIAIPTTAGTGAEVTPFATVWDGQGGKKYSLALPNLHPQVALLDPELTMGAPRDISLTTGLDALSQGLESMWSRSATPLTRDVAAQSVNLSLRCLPRLLETPNDINLRSDMLKASLLAGLAISITKTTLPHSISYPVTMRFGVPHGLACALTLGPVLRFNAVGKHTNLKEIPADLGLNSIESLDGHLRELLIETRAISRLSQLISSRQDLQAIAESAITPGRADNNPRLASIRDVKNILDEAWSDLL